VGQSVKNGCKYGSCTRLVSQPFISHQLASRSAIVICRRNCFQAAILQIGLGPKWDVARLHPDPDMARPTSRSVHNTGTIRQSPDKCRNLLNSNAFWMGSESSPAVDVALCRINRTIVYPTFGKRPSSPFVIRWSEYGLRPKNGPMTPWSWGGAPGYGGSRPSAKHGRTAKCATLKTQVAANQ